MLWSLLQKPVEGTERGRQEGDTGQPDKISMKMRCLNILIFENQDEVSRKMRIPSEPRHRIITKQFAAREKSQREEIGEAKVDRSEKASVCWAKKLNFYPI